MVTRSGLNSNMFYGVNGSPFLDLAPFLDLSDLDGVIEEVTNYISADPIAQLVPFTNAQEIHSENPNAKYLGNAIRLRTLVREAANALEITGSDEPAAQSLPYTMQFIRSLPLKGVGRTSIYFTNPGESVPTHRDYAEHPGFNNQFIYLNPILKPFFVVGPDGNKHMINTRASIFNPSDFHGMDMCDQPCFSIRVNGFWTDDLINKTHLHNFFKRY